MTIRESMALSARRGCAALGRRETIADYVMSKLHAGGGFVGRGEGADLYYTAFAVQCLAALEAPIPERTIEYVRSFGAGRGLDLVHLACLARCLEIVPQALRPRREELAGELLRHRREDGGFSHAPHTRGGSAYGCFLAAGAFEDCGLEMPDARAMLKCLSMLRTPSGGYANDQDLPFGLVTATAAALTVQRALGEGPDEAAVRWLLTCASPEGGFLSSPSAGAADLLSTATAMHALAEAQSPKGLGQLCLNFVGRCASRDGGYQAGPWDSRSDCEYTFYAMLAAGHAA
jgi:hypothetical protein